MTHGNHQNSTPDHVRSARTEIETERAIIGDLLQETLDELEMTQSALAAAMGVTEPIVSQMCNGRRSFTAERMRRVPLDVLRVFWRRLLNSRGADAQKFFALAVADSVKETGR